MTQYRIIVTPDAVDDMVELRNYIADVLCAPDTALSYIRAVRKEIAALSEMPARYRPVDDEPWHSRGIWKLLVKNSFVYRPNISRTIRSAPFTSPVSAELILRIALHICPPLNVSGVCVMSCHSSASLPFHVAIAHSRFLTTQFSLMVYTSLSGCNYNVLTDLL